MTISLEKIFFAYILKNKKYFQVVISFFFKNKEIELVYGILQKYILSNPEADTPSPKQILEMVRLEDKDGIITPSILKSMLSEKLGEYDEENFILPNFKSWILKNKLKAGVADLVEKTRDLDTNNDFDSMVDSSNKMRKIIEDSSKLDFIDDGEMGMDFDDPESHIQDNSKYKVKSGFDTVDHSLGGGWDVQTLNVIMGETSQGKSLWMQNFAIRSANLGYNVLYITLEMSEKKVMKRIGSMRLRIPINEYDDQSKDVDFIRKKIENLKYSSDAKIGGDLFEKKLGKIITKFWAAGTATINDFDNYITKLKEKRGIKIDFLIVDYITLITTGSSGETLYIKGKNLSEGLRALGSKYNVPVLTAIQVAKDAWSASDIKLESIPESKAIAETADTFFAIIRTPEMKRQNIYRFKLLKQRDGDFLQSQIKVSLNATYLTLENDIFLDSI